MSKDELTCLRVIVMAFICDVSIIGIILDTTFIPLLVCAVCTITMSYLELMSVLRPSVYEEIRE